MSRSEPEAIQGPSPLRSTRRRALTCSVVLLLATSVLLGCRPRKNADDVDNTADDDVSSLQDGSDTAAAESDAQLLTSSLVSASPGSIGLATVDLSDSDLDPREIGDGARAIYLPRGCLTVASDPATQTATYTFNRCLGPNGLRGVTGEVKVRYRSDAGQLHLDLTATELTLNRASVDWSASADITESGAERTMKWSAQLSGATARGRTFGRSTQHTISWRVGESCFALDGASTGVIDRREVRLEIQGFRRCRRECPDAGGKIVLTNVTKNRRFELRYDGTNQAMFVDPLGREIAVPLLCSP